MEINSFVLIPGKSDYPNQSQAGGKGLSLWSLVSNGFTVPPFIILSADLFREYRKHANQLFLEKETANLIQIIRTELGNCPYFAVRSSAVSEDGQSFSFAGQFKTVLNVKEAELTDAIQQVWDSADSEQVISYLKHQTAEHKTIDLAMSVVIQAMIPSEKSGVAFAVDPVSGNRKVRRIAAVKGLGELLVSGESDAYEYLVENNQCKLVSTHHNQSETLLSNDEVLRIAVLLDKTTDFYTTYQDIEWTMVGGELYLLQSRPITQLHSVPDSSEELQVWDNSNITESYPDRTSPLTFSFIEDIYREVYKQFCRVLGVEESLIQKKRTDIFHAWTY